RGVKSMKLMKDDELISMDILPSSIVDKIADIDEEELELEEADLELENGEIEEEETEETSANNSGPWALVITTGGYGKRVPVSQFTLQNRGGKGRIATKFKKKKRKQDKLASLRIVNETEELIMITTRGIIIRQAIDAISIQSRSATGVRVQKLDDADSIAEVALVPATEEEIEETEDIDVEDMEDIDAEEIEDIDAEDMEETEDIDEEDMEEEE
ncbi:MAG: DNA gyrase subunit A, partial [Okeania sp. SIO3C4]|nr:DNA gyrase subunit A [Okeania sp. SIO3C4]